jgi:hypothetical protein
MSKKTKKLLGFTVAELCAVLAVVGFISALGIINAKPYNKTTSKLYSRAYDVLSIAAYNYSLDVNSQAIETPEELCKGLTKYINSMAATSPKAGEEFTGNPNSGYCNNITSRATDTTEIFQDLTPDFVSNNGMKFYISDKRETSEITASDNSKSTIEYYIIFVDIDGEKGNGKISTGVGSSRSDVVAFALTDDADIIPLGSPITNKTYLSARVGYPEDDTHKYEYYSKNMTYYDALHRAWGGNTTFEDLRTFDFNDFLSNSSAIKKDLVYPSTTPARDDECSDFDCEVKILRFF